MMLSLKRFLPFTGPGGLRALLAALLIASLFLSFGYISEEALEGDMDTFDHVVAMAMRMSGDAGGPVGPPWMEEIGRDVTAIGSPVALSFIIVASIGYLLLARRRGAALLLGTAVVSGAALNTALKFGFDRARPDIPHVAHVFTPSFPSGHATLSTIAFLTIATLIAQLDIDRRIKAYCFGLALFMMAMVGLSRIYLGLHFASDVLASWCLGSAWTILCCVGAAWLEQQKA